jgi:hypothetical protein
MNTTKKRETEKLLTVDINGLAALREMEADIQRKLQEGIQTDKEALETLIFRLHHVIRYDIIAT